MSTAVRSKCSVDYCIEEVRTKGFCGRHYTSWWRNGSAIMCDVNTFPTSPDPNVKFCTKCLKAKTLDSYHLRIRNGKETYDGACKKCISDQSIDYRKNRRPEHVAEKITKNRARRLALKKYGEEGLTVQERMEAGEPCDICGGKTARMAIDHDHDTGKVRGLLCSNCNTGLGLFEDNIEQLKTAIDYLLKAKR